VTEPKKLAKFGYGLLALLVGYFAAGLVYIVLERVLVLVIVSTGAPLGVDFVNGSSGIVALLVGLYVGVLVYGRSTSRPAVESKPILDDDGQVAASWLDEVMRQIETVFQTKKGLVAGLADGRALARVDGRYKVFESISGYRRAARDDGQWQENADAVEKARFLAEARADLAAPDR
jgi:hypothetical protein